METEAQRFMEQALVGEFQVAIVRRSKKQQWLSMVKWIPASGAGLDEAKTLGRELLSTVPRKKGWGTNPELTVTHEESPAGSFSLLRLSLMALETAFLNELDQLAIVERERSKHKSALNLAFDKKVREEVASDPEIQKLTQALAESAVHHQAQKAALEVREQELREKRESTRSSYLYIADDREI